MTRRPAGWTVAIVVGTGTLAFGQKVVGPQEFDRAMKTIGAAVEGVEEALGSASYVEAKTPLALARQVLASTRPEWETNGQPDAVRMNREAVAALDALDEALSATKVDAAAVAAAFGDVTRACDACHATYREGDARTGYRIRSTVSSGMPSHVLAPTPCPPQGPSPLLRTAPQVIEPEPLAAGFRAATPFCPTFGLR